MSYMLEAQPLTRQKIIDPAHQAAPPPPRRSWWRILLWLAGFAMASAAVYATAVRIQALKAEGTKKAPPPRVIPVVTATAEQRDLGLYLSGLGTVTAFNTVTIRSRVEGELVKVAFSEGQVVEQGQLLAESDPRSYQVQLEQAEGQLAKDQAALKNSQLDLARSMSLVGSKAVTQQQVDTQAALVQQNEGVVKSDQAQVDSAQLQLSYCKITAPIAGRIGLRVVDQGNMIHANDPQGLAVITQLQPISVIFTIPQVNIPRVQKRINQGEQLAVDAYDVDRSFNVLLATGKLAALDNQVDPLTGTLRLKAVFENKENELFPNQFVNARLLVETLKDATVIPTVAIQHGPTSNFVYVVKPDNTVDMRNVLLGPAEGEVTAIESGLAPGDVVVTDGVDKLQPGSKVTVGKPHKSETAKSEASSPGTASKDSPGTGSAASPRVGSSTRPPAARGAQ